jgi:hypothetical protein
MTDSRPDSWSITVARTGGFAGLKREWHVSSADAPEVDWPTLIDACPWKDAAKPSDSRARDQFVWRVEARDASRSCTATLGDGQLTGAWKSLVDEVRARKRD